MRSRPGWASTHRMVTVTSGSVLSACASSRPRRWRPRCSRRWPARRAVQAALPPCSRASPVHQRIDRHRMAACPTAPSPSVAIPGIAGCTSSCDQIEAGTAVHAGVTDCRSNAPEIALGRPLLVENRHCESCSCLRALHAKKSWCP